MTRRAALIPCSNSRAQQRAERLFIPGKNSASENSIVSLFPTALPTFLTPSIKVLSLPCCLGSLHVAHHSCRPCIAILCWSWKNPSLLEEYLAVSLSRVNSPLPCTHRGSGRSPPSLVGEAFFLLKQSSLPYAFPSPLLPLKPMSSCFHSCDLPSVSLAHAGHKGLPSFPKHSTLMSQFHLEDFNWILGEMGAEGSTKKKIKTEFSFGTTLTTFASWEISFIFGRFSLSTNGWIHVICVSWVTSPPFKNVYLFGCLGSLLYHVGPLVEASILSCFRRHMGCYFLTRDCASIPCIRRWVLKHWTNREVPTPTLFLLTSFQISFKILLPVTTSPYQPLQTFLSILFLKANMLTLPWLNLFQSRLCPGELGIYIIKYAH